MGEYLMYVSCGNSKLGDAIFRCPRCSHVYCAGCGKPDPGHWRSILCPKCSKNVALYGPERIGEIKR